MNMSNIDVAIQFEARMSYKFLEYNGNPILQIETRCFTAKIGKVLPTRADSYNASLLVITQIVIFAGFIFITYCCSIAVEVIREHF